MILPNGSTAIEVKEQNSREFVAVQARFSIEGSDGCPHGFVMGAGNEKVDGGSELYEELSLPRTSAGLRLLQVEAARLGPNMVTLPPGEGGGGGFLLPSREPVVPGDRIDVEVEFGDGADPILCSGVVFRTTPGAEWGAAPNVHVVVARTHAHRIRYVRDAVLGVRHPTARKHPRYRAGIDGRMLFGLRPQPLRVSDLSLGGTFVASPARPRPGSELDLELRETSRSIPIRVRSRVIWISQDRDRPGFGTEFHTPDQGTETRLAKLVQAIEANGLAA